MKNASSLSLVITHIYFFSPVRPLDGTTDKIVEICEPNNLHPPHLLAKGNNDEIKKIECVNGVFSFRSITH